MPNQYNDGNIPFGSLVVSMGGSFVAEDIDVEQGSNTFIRRNEVNVPTGAVHTKDLAKVTMTVQLPTNGNPPALFALASFDSGNYIVTKVGKVFKQDDIRKAKLELTAKIN